MSGFGIAEEEVTPLSGTGGGAGPGTRAGEGEPSGEGISDSRRNRDKEEISAGEGPATAQGEELVGRSEASKEVAALGASEDHDRTPSLEYGEGDRPRGPTIGEALGSGVGSSTGSSTAHDDSIGAGQALAGTDDAATDTSEHEAQSGE